MKVTYIYHSAFLVETDNHVLIFDYYKGELPKYDSSKKVYVFASHAHFDHYNKEILKWGKTYILADDITAEGGENVHFIGPDMSMNLDDIQIQTLRSTDEGVAFLVVCEGKKIYFAGDLNWWHWREESDAYNQDMAKSYQAEINKLAGQHIDLAFIPLDPRLEDAYGLGLDYFMKQTDTDVVIPMHMWGKYKIQERLHHDKRAASYQSRVKEIVSKGDSFLL
ncbi:MBL fold metallo-hydrolase [Ohessyouella blattaphilus]|uniref:MBL fold metallo-hydrolase n=1 Tax=Ohessyouella blattaphilus TaxID=2949333 RepID=UPI003EBB7E0D